MSPIHAKPESAESQVGDKRIGKSPEPASPMLSALYMPVALSPIPSQRSRPPQPGKWLHLHDVGEDQTDTRILDDWIAIHIVWGHTVLLVINDNDESHERAGCPGHISSGAVYGWAYGVKPWTSLASPQPVTDAGDGLPGSLSWLGRRCPTQSSL